MFVHPHPSTRLRNSGALALLTSVLLAGILSFGCSERDSVTPPSGDIPEEDGTLALTLNLELASPPVSTNSASRTLTVAITVVAVRGDDVEELLLETERQIEAAQTNPSFELEVPPSEQAVARIVITGARTRPNGATGTGLLHAGEAMIGRIESGAVTSATLTLTDRVPTVLLVETPSESYRLQWSPVEGAERYRVRTITGGVTEEFTSTALDSVFAMPAGRHGPDEGDAGSEPRRAEIEYRVLAELTGGSSSAYSEPATFEEPGLVPPAAVTDLAVLEADPTQVLLSWTAPGDDGTEGRASAYDVRRSDAPIEESDFALAIPVSGTRTPNLPGNTELLVVDDLTPETTYYFALKTRDEVPNVSSLSNLVSATTPPPPDTEAPSPITDLSVDRTGESTIVLSWAAPQDDAGPANAYEVRSSTEPLDAGNFVSGTKVPGAPPPGLPDTKQTLELTNLAPAVYYIGVRSRDLAGNTSPVSNIVSASTIDETAPARVDDLSAELTEGQASLRWTASGDNDRSGRADRYDLRYADFVLNEESFDDATPVELSGDPKDPGSEETIEHADLRAETTYSFGLRVFDEAGNSSGLSNVVTSTTSDFEPPAPVRDLRAEEVTGTRAEFYWTAPGDNGDDGRATRYDMRFSLNPITEENFDDAVPVGGIEEIEPQLAGGLENVLLVASEEVQVYLALQTRDEIPNVSGLSNTVFVRFGDDAPNAPADLTAQALNASEIELGFTDTSTDEDFFEIERRAEGEAGFERVAVIERGQVRTAALGTVQLAIAESRTAGDLRSVATAARDATAGGEAITFVDSGLEERTLYTYRTRAHNAGGPSAYSTEASARTTLGAPYDLHAAPVDDVTLDLQWSFGADPNGFRIERRDNGDWTEIADLPGDRRTYRDGQLAAGSTYRYRMRAYDDAGVSVYSNEAAGATGETPPICYTNRTVVEFGAIPVGLATVEIVTLENRGGGRLTGALSHDCIHFAAGEQPYDLGPGESVPLQIGFRPEAPGDHVCEIYLDGGCDPIVVTGTGLAPALCSVDVSTLDFGDVHAGETETRFLHIKNVGGSPLAGNLSIDCTDHYEILAGGGSYTLMPGEELEIEVAFAPTDPGVHTCSLRTGTDQCDDIEIIGVALPGPQCAYLEHPIDFGTVAVGGSATRRIRIQNTGQGTLSGVLGADCGDVFQLSGPLEYELEAGEIHEAFVTFAPENVGSYVCTIFSGDQCESLLVTGESMELEPCRPTADVLEFEEVEVGQTTIEFFDVENLGDTDLVIEPVLSTRCPGDVFVIRSGGGVQTISPGDTHTIGVQFEPETPGESYLCSLYLENSGCPSIELSGRGKPLPCTIEGDGDFGSMLVGQTYERTYRLINYSESLMLGVVTPLACNASVVEITSGAGPYALSPGDAHDFTVRFDPIVGFYRCAVAFDNALCEKLDVTGTGEVPVPDCQVAGDPNFEAILGQAVDRSFTVTNTGNTVLDLNVQLGGEIRCLPFQILRGAGEISLEPGDVHKIQVSFQPEHDTVFACTLDFGSEACGALGLWGEVVAAGD